MATRYKTAEIGRYKKHAPQYRAQAKKAVSGIPEEIDPLSDMEYTGNESVDGAAEVEAIVSNFQSRKMRALKDMVDIGDAQYYSVFWFRSKAHRDCFLRACGLDDMGKGTFIDGEEACRRMGVDLGGVAEPQIPKNRMSRRCIELAEPLPRD